MTQDINPILTKSDYHLMRATLTTIENVDEDPYYVLIHADKYKNQEKRMEQILTVLEQYPKLKEELERVKEFANYNTFLQDEITKLKAENEELTKQLFDKEQQRLELANPKEKECPVCKGYAKYFDREYSEAYCAYHDKHICVCGHLHKSDEINCENKCGCDNYIAKADLKELQLENSQLKHDLSDVIYRYENNTEIADLRLTSDMLGCGKNHVVLEVQKLKQLKQRVEGLNDFVNKINCKNNILFEEFLVYIKSELQQLLKDDTV